MKHWLRIYWPLRHPTRPRPYLVSSKRLHRPRGRTIAALAVMLTFAAATTWLSVSTHAGFVQAFGVAFLVGVTVVAPILVLITPGRKR